MEATSPCQPSPVAHRPAALTAEINVEPEATELGESSTPPQVSSEPAQPFLRWAGGKRWLLYYLPKILKGFEVRGYHEPFLGGGAVFFGSAVTEQANLSDLNGELNLGRTAQPSTSNHSAARNT